MAWSRRSAKAVTNFSLCVSLQSMSYRIAWVSSCQKVLLRSSAVYLYPLSGLPWAMVIVWVASSKQPWHNVLPTTTSDFVRTRWGVRPMVTCFGIFTSLLRIVCYNLFRHLAVCPACTLGLSPSALKPKPRLLWLRSRVLIPLPRRARLIRRNTSFVS